MVEVDRESREARLLTDLSGTRWARILPGQPLILG
jgi:hypothetical protein